jgi:glycosyltransferase involved in cell wall biosynthesis
MPPPADSVAFMFHYGHGHATQLDNFKECVPAEYAARCEWVALRGESSGSRLAKLPLLPPTRRYAFNYAWHGYDALKRRPEWRALFIAGCPPSFLPLIHRYPTYTYNDFSPSLTASLAPWYPPSRARDPVQFALRRLRFRRGAGVFAMSKWSADGHAADYGIPRERIHVSLPGANLNRWNFIDRSARTDRDPVRILMVAGEFVRKGGDLLLQWAESTNQRNWQLDIVSWPGQVPRWIFELLGCPPSDGRASVSLAPRLPGVRVHVGLGANTPELMKLYEEADIFCLPTHADGSSIASLEAMACGLPVVVSAVGGIPELIHDGETALLMRRGDYDDMAAKLEQLIGDRDLRLKLGRQGRQSCEDYFNVTRQLREIMEVIDHETGRLREGAGRNRGVE